MVSRVKTVSQTYPMFLVGIKKMYSFDSSYSAIATYKGSLKKFFIAIAMQLYCPTENEHNRPLTVDALKQEILENAGEDTLLIFPESKYLKKSLYFYTLGVD
jgi:hypothetical protein